MLASWIMLVAMALPQSAANVTAPDTVKNGEAILFQVADSQPGDVITWRVLHPRGRAIRTINTRYGVEFIVDPPIGYSGSVEVLVTVLNWRSERFDQRELVVQVAGGDVPNPDDDDDVPPGPPPPGPDDYTGPDVYGVGKLAWQNAPGYSAEVVRVYRQAAEFLKGRPELKVIYHEDPNRNRTEENVNIWINARFRELFNDDPKWATWYRVVHGKFVDLNQSRPMTLDDWYAALSEIASGVEGRQ